MMKLLSCILVIFCFGWFQSKNAWVLDVNKENIKVFVRKSDSSSIKEYRAMMVVKSPLDTVLKTILDIKNLKKWSYKTSVSNQVKKLSDSSWVFYIQNNLDWPIKDRDHVSKVVLKKKKKEYIISLTPANGFVKETPKMVRIKNFKGFWDLKKVDDDHTQVIQQMFGDPQISAPSFIVNGVLSKAPYESFKNLRKILEQKTSK